MIRVTLPASSGSTSVINYALNAPAIGASFPLTVNASQVQGRTDGASASTGYIGEIIGSTSRPGTGGFTYSTALSGSGSWGNNVATSMGTQTLGKGTYLVCVNSSAALTSGASRSFDLQLFIGGTNITPNFYYSTPGFNNGTADIQMTIPLVITADSTVVDIRGRVTGGADTVTVYGQMSFVRIA
jgi:hypothetical protein